MKEAKKEDIIVINGEWREEIKRAFEHSEYLHNDQNFLDSIWEVSLTAFDIPREVQAVVDDNDNIFISVGNPGFVWFEKPPEGMKLPIRCWIHTHPFGSAYFSSTDWKTIRTWEPVMNEAIVLGDSEGMVWRKGEPHTIHYERVDIPEWIDGQMTLDDFAEEEE